MLPSGLSRRQIVGRCALSGCAEAVLSAMVAYGGAVSCMLKPHHPARIVLAWRSSRPHEIKACCFAVDQLCRLKMRKHSGLPDFWRQVTSAAHVALKSGYWPGHSTRPDLSANVSTCAACRRFAAVNSALVVVAGIHRQHIGIGLDVGHTPPPRTRFGLLITEAPGAGLAVCPRAAVARSGSRTAPCGNDVAAAYVLRGFLSSCFVISREQAPWIFTLHHVDGLRRGHEPR